MAAHVCPSTRSAALRSVFIEAYGSGMKIPQVAHIFETMSQRMVQETKSRDLQKKILKLFLSCIESCCERNKTP